MHVKPVRYQEQRCLHFITFSCYHRQPLLDAFAAKEIFEAELERVRVWYGCYVTGYVVMPEHVRLPISERERSKLSVVIQMLKQITSQRLRPEVVVTFHPEMSVRKSPLLAKPARSGAASGDVLNRKG